MSRNRSILTKQLPPTTQHVRSMSVLTAIEPAAREFLLTGSLWTPANFFAVAIENIHLMTGTSWPVTIALFTVGLRAALFPFTVKQTRSSVLATNLKPTLDRLRTESMQHRTAGNTDLAKDKMAEMQALMKENGVGPGRLLAYGLIPAPFFVATFFALKAMTEQALPSMLTGGAFWFTDLCAADPYYILPCLTTATLLLVNEISSKLNPMGQLPAMRMFMRMFTFVSIPITAAMPSAMVFYFVISNLITAGIQSLWHIPAARAFFRIPRLLAPPASGAAAPAQGFMETFKHAYQTSLNEAQTAKSANRLAMPSTKEYERNLRKSLR